MSDEIYEGPTMYVTRYVGPADEGDDRQRWQFAPLDGDVAVLTREDVWNLTSQLLADLTHTRPRLTSTARRG